MIASLLFDLRTATRGLMRSPGFTMTAVLILALGIGANGAVFTVLKETVLAPPAWPEAEELVLLDLVEGAEARPIPWSYPKWSLLRDAEPGIAGSMAAWGVRSVTVTGAGDPYRATAEFVTPDYLGTLGVEPAYGRDFGPDQAHGGGEPDVALITDELARRRFGSEADAVGRALSLNGTPLTVAGVLPSSFSGLSGDAELLVPLPAAGRIVSPVVLRAPHAHWLQVVARAEGGIEGAGLADRMEAIGRRVQETYPMGGDDAVVSGGARGLIEARTNPAARRSVLYLSGAALLVLLIAITNLAGLMIARSVSRGRESAVRLALGSGRMRLMRTHLFEGAALAAAGGALGLLLTGGGADLLARHWPDRFMDGGWNLRFADPARFGVDGSTLLFTVGLSLAAAVLVGALSGWLAARGATEGRLRLGQGSTDLRSSGTARGGLVVAQIAVTLVLLVGAGVLARSFLSLERVDRGFGGDNVMAFQVAIPPGSAWSADRAEFFRLFTERLEASPLIEAAGVGCPPVSRHCWIGGVTALDGEDPAEEGLAVGIQLVDRGWFSALRVQPVGGRLFDEGLGPDDPPQVVLSERAAEEFFPGGAAIGRRIAFTIGLTSDGRDAEVVGVVPDILFGTPREGIMPEAFVSVSQMPESESFVVRASGDPSASLPHIRSVLSELDPTLPVFDVRTLEALDADTTGDTRVLLGLLALFAGVALTLSAAGIWGVVSFDVSRRRRELGVRMALGADRGRVVGLFLRRGMILVGVGSVAGAVGAWYAVGLLDTLLYDVTGRDPVVFGVCALALAGVTLAATWIPARAATRIAPTEAMRVE